MVFVYYEGEWIELFKPYTGGALNTKELVSDDKIIRGLMHVGVIM